MGTVLGQCNDSVGTVQVYIQNSARRLWGHCWDSVGDIEETLLAQCEDIARTLLAQCRDSEGTLRGQC